MSTTFDLHVLSTPPAFILSQDQTLNKMVSKEPKFFKSSYRSLIHSFKEIKSRAFFKLALVRRTSRPFWCFVFLSRCLIYKVHALASRSGWRAIYFSTLGFACQELFQVFSGLFSPEPLVLVLFQARSFLPARTYLVYHAHSRLSSTFFWSLSEGRPGSPRFLPVLVRFSCPLARRSDRISLSTTFVNTFLHFSFDFFIPSKHYLYIV